ncbi:DTW domain-containing protein [Pseudoalteromonas sp. KS88]|uniref:tRNA-uridine aminocarboxypropyltransferase n=1 Tax=Pseudoalteromonas sp. KS88 TaxID=2109918 RepID=UPI00107FD537|nr:tRNA-uridine aminocarboxypropyltransferase [Pseudoalteromonas sp. KS88]TGE81289.1 DTW domain-containing protein [Pseudoalteromonas sp. KS88]
MSRALCPNCQFSPLTCLCNDLVAVNNKLKIIILQHPSEVKVTKNTAKLLNLCLSQCTVIHGESQEDFQFLTDLPTKTTALLYPNEHAILLDTKDEKVNELKTQLTHLIVLDGTWKKAFKIMQLTPKLNDFVSVSFNCIPTNRYHIRKAPRVDSLSTLEAVAYSLMLVEQQDPTPLYTVLDALNHKQTQLMPAHVKARYNKS